MSSKELENRKFICKGCDACCYCSAEICKTWHCGFALTGCEEFKLNCEDNDCIVKKLASFLMDISNDPKYAMKALPLLYGLKIEYASEKASLMQKIKDIISGFLFIFKR